MGEGAVIRVDEARVDRVFGKNGLDLVREQASHDAIFLPRLEEYLADPSVDQALIRWQAIYLRLHLVFFCHFGFEPQHGSVQDNVLRGIDSALDFFFGEWRNGLEYLPGEKLTVEDCRNTIGWLLPYRESILLTLLVDDLEAAKQISRYPGHDAIQESMDGTAELHEFYILLARYFCGSALDEQSSSVNVIESGKKRGPKLCLKVLQAIDKREAESASVTLHEYLLYFLKSEKDVGSFSGGISMNGSILWNLARIRGLPISQLSEVEKDVVVTPVSCRIVETGCSS